MVRQEGGNKEFERHGFHKIGVLESSKAIGKKGPFGYVYFVIKGRSEVTRRRCRIAVSNFS